MARKIKADVFAGEGSVAGNLRKRRQAMDAGDPSGGQAKDYHDKPDMRGENAPGTVIRRGYMSVEDDEQ